MKKMIRGFVAVAFLVALCGSSVWATSDVLPDEMLRGITARPLADELESEALLSAEEPSAPSVIPLQDGQYINEISLQPVVTPEAQEALLLSPDWLRMDLYDMFIRLSASKETAYGQLVIDAAADDPRMIDEVAFLIAHSSKSVLNSGDPEILLKNVQLLHQIDSEIAYADIVDHGEPGIDSDFYSTVKYYTIRGGEMAQFELPRDIYYYFIVHPKLGDEDPSMSPVISDRTSTYGYLWREYLFYNPSADYDYTVNYMMKEPNLLDDADLDGIGPSATGYLTGDQRKVRDGIVVSDSDTEKCVLIEYPYNMTRVIVTTLNAEKAYNAGKRDLLENLVMRSHGGLGDTLQPNEWVAILDESGNQETLDPIKSILDSHDVNYEVYGMTAFLRGMITHNKLIIPSNQSLAFYEDLAEEDASNELKSYLNVSGPTRTFLFLGACDPGNSWAGLEMAFAVSYVADEIDDVTINPYPVLKDVISNATHLWDDSVVNASLDAYRPFEPDSMAVDVVSNWTCRNLPFRARGNRPIQPNQICYEHNGNCGEIQDLMNAAARTCLLPCAGVNNHTWDHVTNEFWEQEWHGYQVDWNGNHASIAKQSVLYDKDFGGSKELSAISQDRGDGYPVNATSRFSKYCRFHARVEDRQGNPVDGAQVIPEVHLNNQPTYPIWSPISAYTDSTGEVVVDLGNNRDFYFRVNTKIGGLDRAQLLTGTVEDEDYQHTFVIDRTMPSLPSIEPVVFGEAAWPFKLHVSFNVDWEMLYTASGLSFGTREDAGNVDFFIVDEANYGEYKSDVPFSAYEWREDTKSADFEVEIPGGEPFYLVFSNEDVIVVKQFVSINVEVYKRSGGSWTMVESIDDFVPISAQDAHVLKFLGDETSEPPQIWAAGMLNADADSSSEFEFGMQAFVVDPDGLADVKDVEIYYSGVPLGIYLRDDGIEPDALPGDGIFTHLQHFEPSGLGAGVYKLELVATDFAGNKSSAWPYLNVLPAPITLTSKASQRNVRIWQPLTTAYDAPTIVAGGFFGNEAIGSGDLLNFIVLVSDPNGASDIDKVELFLEGGLETGLFFNDDGINGDAHAGDGFYTFQTVAPGGLPLGYMTLEVVAFDKSGNSSATYPYFNVR